MQLRAEVQANRPGDSDDGYPHQLRGAGSQRLPGSEVEVSGHAALNTDSVSSTVVGKRATQIVLPAAEDALQQAFWPHR